MSTNTSRRNFLKAISTVSGGLVLGIDFGSGLISTACASQSNTTFQPSAWLRIDSDGTFTITVAKSEMGQGIRTALPMLIAEELEADWTKIRIEPALAHPDKYGSQSTGGSTSVRTLYSTLRKAGASAKEMFVSAAAKQWNVSESDCRAENGTVVLTSNGKKLSYGELASSAASLPVPDKPTLKDSKDFKFLGRKMPRLDTPSKVDGSAIFGMDIQIPNMVYAVIVRPHVFGAKVKSFDATKAKAIAGVLDVVQTDDLLAVLANSTWSAIQGRDALSVSWDEGDYANESSETMWKMFEAAAGKEGDIERNDGDAKSAYELAAKKVEAMYYAPFAAHVTMEPMNCTVHLQENSCEIWAPSQTPQDALSEAADILGMSTDDIKFNITLLGGGFGRRLETDYVVEAVKLAKALKEPVKVVWTREDDMQHDFYRPAQYNIMRGGLDADGSPTTWLHSIIGHEGKGLLTHACNPPYDFPNLRIDAQAHYIGVPSGAWRSVGASQNGFIIECFVDELAYAAGKDPVEFRKNLLSKSPRLKKALELVAEKSGWGTPMPKGKGRGVACVSSFGSHVAQVAEVSVADDGSVRVERMVCAVECGPVVNPDGIEAQMESAVAFGLSATLKDEITIERGGVKQSNFDDYRMLMIDEMPKVETYFVKSDEAIGGIGEPGVPPVAPAVCNAIFAATGKRVRRLPVKN
ncbi:MAG: xanthine dehydrogenase family protein molybdopterin-binding subunit [Ignavibacteriae bacterium]|nr:xanthine dehydrogenase family protein molybdopterin-binding subunit [Ignavibacteriota bacterium]